jgi:hypothetical protein
MLLICVANSFVVAPRADIAHSPDFESGVVKVLGGQAKHLSRPERAALQPFLRAVNVAVGQTGEAEPTEMGFADRILKRRKVEVAPSAYELLAVIPPTSNIVERAVQRCSDGVAL